MNNKLKYFLVIVLLVAVIFTFVNMKSSSKLSASQNLKCTYKALNASDFKMGLAKAVVKGNNKYTSYFDYSLRGLVITDDSK